MNDTKIKACPFCGRQGFLTETTSDKTIDHRHTVICAPGCGASGMVGASPEEAVAAWNQRAGDRQPEAVQNAGTIAGSFQRMVKSPGGFQLDSLEMEKSIKLLNVCGQDEDAASLVVLGESIRAAKGCVLVLKGRDETHWLRDMLIRHKLLTQAKEITKDF